MCTAPRARPAGGRVRHAASRLVRPHTSDASDVQLDLQLVQILILFFFRFFFDSSWLQAVGNCGNSEIMETIVQRTGICPTVNIPKYSPC